jgi:hypothetical protein
MRLFLYNLQLCEKWARMIKSLIVTRFPLCFIGCSVCAAFEFICSGSPFSAYHIRKNQDGRILDRVASVGKDGRRARYICRHGGCHDRNGVGHGKTSMMNPHAPRHVPYRIMTGGGILPVTLARVRVRAIFASMLRSKKMSRRMRIHHACFA